MENNGTRTQESQKSQEIIGTKTVKQIAEENNFRMSYKPLTEDGVKILLMAEMIPNFIKTMIEDPEYTEMFLTQILMKRIEAFDLKDKVNLEALFLYLAFGADNPGKAIVYLIALVEFYEITGEVATSDDISMRIFPDGFYDDNTCIFVIDKCMKHRLTIGSEIYVSR